MHRALIVLDGLGDRPNPETGGRTPLEAASTPNLDALARGGALGTLTVIGPGIAPESDAGVLALLGLDPARESPGRGVLEALGIGIDLAPQDIAMRLNFATAGADGRILDSRVGRSLSSKEANELASAITRADLLHQEGVRAEVRSTVGHRGVLWLHPTDGTGLSSEISNSDPFYEKVGGMGRARAPADTRPLPVRATSTEAYAAHTARLVELFLERCEPLLIAHLVNARRALAGKPLANSLLLRHAGRLPEGSVRSFRDRTGLEGAAVTEMPVERGIARWLGLADLFVGPMGADRDKGYAERAETTRAALREHEFVYVHLKGPDEPGHDGRATEKKEIIEAIDRSFVGPFVRDLDWSELRIAVTADHATPCAQRGHSDDPVPLLVAGARTRGPGTPDRAVKFGEADCALGTLGNRRGIELMPLLRGGTAVAPT
ncbi:MAG: alkaline phosphatase family protein [Thermoplasmata archaeon]|nr:alkaline phosphatase family protein [Thermoplasmata archaeon]